MTNLGDLRHVDGTGFHGRHQLISALNRRRVNTRVKKRDPHWVGMSPGVLAIGYREDPVLLESCPKRLRAIRYQRNQRILLVVDGNEAQDEYMSQIFIKVFEKQGAAVFRSNFCAKTENCCDRLHTTLVLSVSCSPIKENDVPCTQGLRRSNSKELDLSLSLLGYIPGSSCVQRYEWFCPLSAL